MRRLGNEEEQIAAHATTWCGKHNRVRTGSKFLSSSLLFLEHVAFVGAPKSGALFYIQPGGLVVYHHWDILPTRLKTLAACVKLSLCRL